MRGRQQIVRTFLTAMLLFSGFMLVPVTAQAMKFDGVARLGFDFGGDSMVKAYFTGGGSSEIKANDGLVLAGGLVMTNDANNLALETTLGWKFKGIEASNQTYDFTRFPLEVVGIYNLRFGNNSSNSLRFGAGMTYHLSPKFSASGSLASGTVDFENAMGTVALIETLISGDGRTGMTLGLRFTNIEYSVSGSASTVNGSGVGLYIGGVF